METCSVCKESLLDGQFWSVLVHREAHETGGIAVLFADCAVSVCMACQPSYSKRSLLELALCTASAPLDGSP
jgi:hypothetical protein